MTARLRGVPSDRPESSGTPRKENVLRGALVGFGAVAEKAHAPAFLAHPGFTLAAVAEESPERRAAAQAALPQAKVYASLGELLRRERLDFVSLATPPFLHARQAAAALRRGLHVLCEKPLALSARELSALSRLSRSRGLALFTVHNWRHAPLYRKLFELLDSGAIGAVSHAELHVLRTEPARSALPGDWRVDPVRSGGGVLVDHGWHNLYLLRKILGGDAAGEPRVAARLHAPAGAAVEHEAAVFIELERATALLRLSWLSPRRANLGAVYGARGEIELADDALVLRRGAASERFDFPEKLSRSSAHPDWMAALLSEFHGECLGRRRGENLREAAFCSRVLSSVYRRKAPRASRQRVLA